MQQLEQRPWTESAGGGSEEGSESEIATSATTGNGAIANARDGLKKTPAVQRRPSLVTASKSLQELVACQAAYHERHF